MTPIGGEQEISTGECFRCVWLSVDASDGLSEVRVHCHGLVATNSTKLGMQHRVTCF